VAGDEQLNSWLRIVVALLCVGAAILLVEILTSDRLDPGDSSKAFGTAVVVAFVGLAIGVGANLVARQPGIALIGYLTIVVGVVALVLGSYLIWHQSNLIFEVGALERWTWYMLIGSFGLGVVSLLLGGHDDSDADSVKLVRGMTVFVLFGLMVCVINEVRIPGSRVDPYLLGSLSVFFVLGCLLLPLLSRITSGAAWR
jgi:hypothetical protein